MTLATSEPDLLRFDRVERLVHWTTATLFGVLMLTGAALYPGPISVLVGHRDVVRMVHVFAGLALPAPLVAGLVGRWSRGLRRDLGRLNRWTVAKFNPGQKLNAAFLGAAVVVMLMTGSIMKWFSLFTLDWRTGATFVHDWFALGIWISISGHVFLAVRDPVALGGMLRGFVTARWARNERPRWYEEETGRPAQRFRTKTAPPNDQSPVTTPR